MPLQRCAWPGRDPVFIWRIMTRNGAFRFDEDNRLFEMLVLESMQTGLSWITILRKT